MRGGGVSKQESRRRGREDGHQKLLPDHSLGAKCRLSPVHCALELRRVFTFLNYWGKKSNFVTHENYIKLKIGVHSTSLFRMTVLLDCLRLWWLSGDTEGHRNKG